MSRLNALVRAVLACCIGLLAIAHASARPAGVVNSECVGGSCFLYLALIARAPPMPLLVSPSAGAQLGSIAPVLSWTTPVTGTYHVQVATDPSFATTVVSATETISAPPQQDSHASGRNLDAATVRC